MIRMVRDRIPLTIAVVVLASVSLFGCKRPTASAQQRRRQ
jgi:hypothetical protein